MSTDYGLQDRVPTAILAKRLQELSMAITEGREAISREFTMRVPAECDRDADLVLSAAAKRLLEFMAAEREGRSAEEAVVKQTPPTPWAWWLEGDDHCHIETTESDCHGPAHESIDSDTEPGIVCEYFIARTAHPLDAIAHDNLAFYLGESIHEDIDMRCADETGAEEESLSITDQDKIELGQLVLDFLRGRAKVQWWGVDKKTEARHTYVAGGDDDESGGVTP